MIFLQRRAKYLLLVCVLLTLSMTVCFWRLGQKPLENWDEGIHAEVSREMLHNNAWISLSYFDQLYTAKPPLKFWLTAPLFPLFGETEFAIRFWSAVAGVATTLLLAWWVWESEESLVAAGVAGILFATGRYIFFHAFRTGETDGLLVFFVVSALYAYWKTLRSPQQRWLLLSWASIGLAVMTKSFAGLVPLMIIMLDQVWHRFRLLRNRFFWYGALVAALIAVPWHAYELFRFGRTFWDSYFGFHVLERTTDVLYANNVSFWWYAHVFNVRTFPYVPLYIVALLYAAYRTFRHRDATARLLLIWIAVVFFLFSIVRTKFDWYILPLYPAAAVCAARMLKQAWNTRMNAWILTAVLVVWTGSIILLPDGIAHAGFLWILTPNVYVPALFHSEHFQQVFVAVVTAVALCVAVLMVWWKMPRRAAGFALFAPLAYLVLFAFGWQIATLRHVEPVEPLQHFANVAQQQQLSALTVAGVKLVQQPAGYFYLRRAGIHLTEEPALTGGETQPLLVSNALRGTVPQSFHVLAQAGAYTLYLPN